MTVLLAWGLLAVAIAIEVAGTSMLKLAEGFAKPVYFFGAIACYGLCFVLLTQIFRFIPLSIAYAIWAGAGAALIVIVDYFMFNQALGSMKLFFIALIIIGVVGVKLAP